MTKKSAKPQLRFAGFDDTWEQRKFDEVFDCTIPNNTLSRAELNYESGSVRNIHYGDILIKYGSIVDVQNDEIPFATGKSSDDFKGALLQDGDIIIADTAEDETTGKACEIGNSQGLDVVSGLHTMVCRPRNKMALGYLGYYLNSDAYHHQLLPLMQGIKVLSLSRTNVQKTMVCYPKSKAEQQLIADCFRNLDTLITLHQRKYDKLTNVKKSMLEKMFPKNGLNVPEIRFKGFNDAWEQRKLLEFGQATGGTSIESEFSEDGIYKVISIGSYSEDSVYRDQGIRAVRSDKTVNRILNKGDITMILNDKTASGNIIGRVLLIEESGGYVYNQRTERIEVDSSNYDSQFIYTMLNAPEIRDKIIKQSQGNTQIYVNWTTVSQTDYLVPQLSEQRRIGEYFSNLDNLITLHQRELEKLKNLKKACLEKMFV